MDSAVPVGLGPTGPSQPVLFDLPSDLRRGDLQEASRLLDIPVGLFQNVEEMVFFPLLEGLDLHNLSRSSSS